MNSVPVKRTYEPANQREENPGQINRVGNRYYWSYACGWVGGWYPWSALSDAMVESGRWVEVERAKCQGCDCG